MTKINTNENVFCFDVDETLVSFDIPSGKENCCISFTCYGSEMLAFPIWEHIELLKRSKMRGHYVRVWSQGGFEWAQRVIEALGLMDYVDSIETKPKWYCDDLKADAWMDNVYLYGKTDGK